jgi:hypothetical protein
VLLYGASYASCVTPPEDCFEGLMQRSELAGRYVLHNYGVGGYGLDQAYLMLRETLDHYAGTNPVVVFLLVADSDLERSSLTYRDWPKPRLCLRDGALQPERPVPDSKEAYLRQYGTGITSFAWRGLIRSPGVLPESWRAALNGEGRKRREQWELIERVLDAIQAEVTIRDLDCTFLLCTSRRGLESPTRPFELGRLESLLAARSIPHADALRGFQEAGAAHEQGLGALYQGEQVEGAHPNLQGNRLIFDCLREQLELLEERRR